MQQGMVDDESTRSVLHCSLILMSSTSSHFNVERKEGNHKSSHHRDKTEEFPDRGQYLFIEDFRERTRTAAENIRALKGIQTKKRKHFSESSHPNKRRKFMSHQDLKSQLSTGGEAKLVSPKQKIKQNPKAGAQAINLSPVTSSSCSLPQLQSPSQAW